MTGGRGMATQERWASQDVQVDPTGTTQDVHHRLDPFVGLQPWVAGLVDERQQAWLSLISLSAGG